MIIEKAIVIYHLFKEQFALENARLTVTQTVPFFYDSVITII